MNWFCTCVINFIGFFSIQWLYPVTASQWPRGRTTRILLKSLINNEITQTSFTLSNSLIYTVVFLGISVKQSLLINCWLLRYWNLNIHHRRPVSFLSLSFGCLCMDLRVVFQSLTQCFSLYSCSLRRSARLPPPTWIAPMTRCTRTWPDWSKPWSRCPARFSQLLQRNTFPWSRYCLTVWRYPRSNV